MVIAFFAGMIVASVFWGVLYSRCRAKKNRAEKVISKTKSAMSLIGSYR